MRYTIGRNSSLSMLPFLPFGPSEMTFSKMHLLIPHEMLDISCRDEICRVWRFEEIFEGFIATSRDQNLLFLV